MKLIKFEQPNCNPCSMVSNYLDSKSIPYDKVNVLEEPEKAGEFGIMSVPVTLLVDDEGNRIMRSVGYQPSELAEMIAKLVNN